MFCVILHQGSHIYVILYVYLPLFIILGFFWPVLKRIFLDIFYVPVLLLNLFLNYLMMRNVLDSGVSLERWQKERAVQMRKWVNLASDRLDKPTRTVGESWRRRVVEPLMGSQETPILPLSQQEIRTLERVRRAQGQPPLEKEDIDQENTRRRLAFLKEEERRRALRVQGRQEAEKRGETYRENADSESLDDMTEDEIRDKNRQRGVPLTLTDISAINSRRAKRR